MFQWIIIMLGYLSNGWAYSFFLLYLLAWLTDNQLLSIYLVNFWVSSCWCVFHVIYSVLPLVTLCFLPSLKELGQINYIYRSINKLQNGVILLIFRLWKFWNIHFAGDLILSTSYEFYYDDVTMTSFINVRYRNVAVEIIPQGTAFCYSFAVSKRT